MSVIVIEFITLDGIISDPDGSAGTPTGGWAFRHGPAAVAGDKFQLGSTLDEGVMVLGRSTWQLFSRLWPGREDPFSTRMNAVPKLVASRTLTDASGWANSTVIDGDRATIRYRYRYGDGPADSVRGVNLMRVRDGQITEALGYSKTGTAVPLATDIDARA